MKHPHPIGLTTAATTCRIDPWRVALFREAVGEAHEEGGAVPPTFLKCLETGSQASASLLQALGIALPGVLHAEQSFEHQKPVFAGDAITLQRKVIGVQHRQGGRLTFITVESQFTREGQTVAASVQTIVVRNWLETLA